MNDEKIIFYKGNNSILRKRSNFVNRFAANNKELFIKMQRIMHLNKGIGLAAVQIGILKQMIVIDIGNGVIKLFNPKIIETKGKKIIMEEGCLSLPGISVKVPRRRCVMVKALNEQAKEVLIEAEDILSRVLQHEIDHLKGKLIVDYLPWFKRLKLYKRKGCVF